MKRIIYGVLILLMCCTLFTACEGKEVSEPIDNRTVSLDQTEMTVVVGGEPAKLNAVLSSGRGAFQWTSSAPEVAAVDQNGNVTGIAVGSATVTVTCGALETASCQVKVVLPGYLPVFTADPTGQGVEKTIALGGSLQLDNSVKFNGETVDAQVTYLSQDSSVVTVSDTGIIKGEKAGKTQIQAVASYMGLEVHMTVEVTVLPE